MAWFGPKGVATMTFSLLVLSQAIPQGERIFNLAALVVLCSVDRARADRHARCGVDRAPRGAARARARSGVGAGRVSSLDGRVFRAVGDVAGGDVGPQTQFEYVEGDDGVIHARYAGGPVRLGFLVGTRAGDSLRFRYAQLLEDGRTATGHCESRIEELPDGRLRLHETWAWDSQPGSGTSVVEEIL